MLHWIHVSNHYGLYPDILTKDDFENNNRGKFCGELFAQKEENKYIPWPTKSCHPDFILRYRGVPLAYSEAKSGSKDTKEGLSYTTILSLNILNFMPPTTPAIVIHSNDKQFRFQIVSLDIKNRALHVLHRTGKKYHMHPKGTQQCPGYDKLDQEMKNQVRQMDNIPLPAHYQFETIHKDTVKDWKKFMEDLQWEHAQKTPKQYWEYDDSYLTGRLHKCDEYPGHYMMINKYSVLM